MIFERKIIIEDLEDNLTGAPINAPNTDNQSVATEESSVGATTILAKASNDIEIDLEEEHKIEAYQVKMNIDIENINKIEKVTNIIQNNGGQTIKLYKNISLMKLTFSKYIYFNIEKIM